MGFRLRSRGAQRDPGTKGTEKELIARYWACEWRWLRFSTLPLFRPVRGVPGMAGMGSLALLLGGGLGLQTEEECQHTSYPGYFRHFNLMA